MLKNGSTTAIFTANATAAATLERVSRWCTIYQAHDNEKPLRFVWPHKLNVAMLMLLSYTVTQYSVRRTCMTHRHEAFATQVQCVTALCYAVTHE